MSTTGINVFDQTIQKSNLWIKELMEELETKDKHFAYLAFRSVLHSLRDRLPKEEAMHLAAQLPLLIGGTFIDGWRLKAKPYKWNRQEFFERIMKGFQFSRIHMNPERIARAVFQLLERHITAGEIEDVVFSLPKDLRNLWPSVNEGTKALRQTEQEQRTTRRSVKKSVRKTARPGMTAKERREQGEAEQRKRLRMAA